MGSAGTGLEQLPALPAGRQGAARWDRERTTCSISGPHHREQGLPASQGYREAGTQGVAGRQGLTGGQGAQGVPARAGRQGG